MNGTLDHISVAAYNPFWRWAAIPLAVVGDLPAIPTFRRSAAEKIAREHIAACGGGVQLLRRRGPRSYELAGVIR